MKIENISQLNPDTTYFVLRTVCENGIDTGIPKDTHTMRFIQWQKNPGSGKITTAWVKTKDNPEAKEYGGILIGDTTGKLIRVPGDTISNNPFRHIFSNRKSAGEFFLSLVNEKVKGWDRQEAPEVKS